MAVKKYTMILIVLVALFTITMAQRPGYLSGPTYPQLASRFRNDNEETSTENLNNRLGEVDGTTEKIPVDARGDKDLVNRVKDWPRQNWPYWYVNADHIERQRNPQGALAPENTVTLRMSQDNVERWPEIRPVYVRFGDEYDLRSRNGVNDAIPVFVRPIRPVVTRPFFAGPLP